MPRLAWGQVTVCELFQDLKASDGRDLIVTGELIVSKNVAVLGAADCDNRYVQSRLIWPVALQLRAAPDLPINQRKQFDGAVAEADRLRGERKGVSASGTFAGRVSLGESEAKLTFHSIEDLKVEELPDSAGLPVIPICELFQNLPAYKGQRIAVRGEGVSTMEGSWISGDGCKGGFVTNGYRWPVSLDYAGPAYLGAVPQSLVTPRMSSNPPKNQDQFRGRQNVTRTSTYVGRLRMRDQYSAACMPFGEYRTNGFGHLAGAAAELIVEEIRDTQLTRPESIDPAEEEADDGTKCEPPNLAALCAAQTTLAGAIRGGCTDRAKEILSRQGIDSQNGGESLALKAAIDAGNLELVELLIEAGASVNPAEFRLWPPLREAANSNKITIMKLLVKAGADVNATDDVGVTALGLNGVFFPNVARVLLDAGANPDVIGQHGETPLMAASGYGYEETVSLLLEHHASVNLRDDKGRTALMRAAAGQYVDAIPLLLEHGADVYARDDEGNTALDLARKSKNEVAVEMLTAAMK